VQDGGVHDDDSMSSMQFMLGPINVSIKETPVEHLVKWQLADLLAACLHMCLLR